MNFSSFDYFLALARERSYTRAADVLHITQQSLSAAIAALELELGCPLVVRRTPLEPTYAGRVFLQYAERFHQTRDEMQRTFCDIAENQRGELRVGIAYTRGRAILPGILEAFAGVYPNVRVILTEERNHTLQNLLHEGRVDLAIARFQKPASRCSRFTPRTPFCSSAGSCCRPAGSISRHTARRSSAATCGPCAGARS